MAGGEDATSFPRLPWFSREHIPRRTLMECPDVPASLRKNEECPDFPPNWVRAKPPQPPILRKNEECPGFPPWWIYLIE